MVLITSFISSFEIKEGNFRLALTTLFSLIFLLNLSIAFEAELLTNPCKVSLDKGIVRSGYLNYLTYYKEIHIISLTFESVDLLLEKAYLILAVCLIVKNNSCCNYSSSTFFLFFLNIALFLSFAADFNFFNFNFDFKFNFDFI